MVDEAQAVAVRPDVDHPHGAVAGRSARIRHVDDGRALDRVRFRDGAVARQEDIDRHLDAGASDPAEGSCQRVHDVREAAGLGPRLAL